MSSNRSCDRWLLPVWCVVTIRMNFFVMWLSSWQQRRLPLLLCYCNQWDTSRSRQNRGQSCGRWGITLLLRWLLLYAHCVLVSFNKTQLFSGAPAFLVLAVTGLASDEEVSFSHATLLGAEGEVLQQVQLNPSSSSSSQSLEQTVGLVDSIPTDPFCVQLTGQDSRGNRLERVSTEMVQPTHVQIQVTISRSPTQEKGLPLVPGCCKSIYLSVQTFSNDVRCTNHYLKCRDQLLKTICFHCFADETQIYLPTQTNIRSSIQGLLNWRYTSSAWTKTRQILQLDNTNFYLVMTEILTVTQL